LIRNFLHLGLLEKILKKGITMEPITRVTIVDQTGMIITARTQGGAVIDFHISRTGAFSLADWHGIVGNYLHGYEGEPAYKANMSSTGMIAYISGIEERKEQ
jgi:hypothetical protein